MGIVDYIINTSKLIMNRIALPAFVLLCCFLLIGASADEKKKQKTSHKAKTQVKWIVMTDFDKETTEYGCALADRNYKKPSPRIKWSKVPDGTKSLVLVVDDIDPRAGGWVHWIVKDIKPTVTFVDRGASENTACGDCDKLPEGAVELENSWSGHGYGAPCPPQRQGPHMYRVRVYARAAETTPLKDKTGKEIITSNDVWEAVKDSIAMTETTFLYPAHGIH